MKPIKTKVLYIRVTSDMLKLLKKAALKSHEHLGEYARRILMKSLEEK